MQGGGGCRASLRLRMGRSTGVLMVAVLATVRLGLPGADAFLNPTLSAARLGGRPLMSATDRSHHPVFGRARSGMRGLLRMSQEVSTDTSTEDVELLSRLREEGSRLETEAGRDALSPYWSYWSFLKCSALPCDARLTTGCVGQSCCGCTWSQTSRARHCSGRRRGQLRSALQ